MKKSCMPYVVIELKSFLNDLDMHDFFFFFWKQDMHDFY